MLNASIWPDALPKWDSLSLVQKKIVTRQADVFAAYTMYSDNEIGRVIQAGTDLFKVLSEHADPVKHILGALTDPTGIFVQRCLLPLQRAGAQQCKQSGCGTDNHTRIQSHPMNISIFFKRDELNHTGAHKVNNVLGQIMLVKSENCWII